mmetsp:Transcript_25947/g.29683  ORF Transcript_25947/g.29683 Transcript_25947/m.29683 type:complete len:81 (+) Transcript_25947:31-273(+)
MTDRPGPGASFGHFCFYGNVPKHLPPLTPSKATLESMDNGPKIRGASITQFPPTHAKKESHPTFLWLKIIIRKTALRFGE